MAWKIKFTETSQKQLSKLDKQVTIRILKWLEERVANSNNPRLWGKSLTGNESGKWRYRVGDYRVVCEILDNELIVKVANRQSVYD